MSLFVWLLLNEKQFATLAGGIVAIIKTAICLSMFRIGMVIGSN